MTDTATRTVEELWRFPIKSMLGERPDSVHLGPHGIIGDRAYALVDNESGKVLSAKHPRRWPLMLRCRAEYLTPPLPDGSLPPVRITLPDGTTVTSDDPRVDAVLSAAFEHDVTLASAAPADFTIDDYHPDVGDGILGPGRTPDTLSTTRLGAAFFAHAGMRSVVPDTAFFDLFPVSVLTTATLDTFTALEPRSRFDSRRFRMNVVIDTDELGFAENDWIGHEITIGNSATLAIAIPDPRCIMTTLEQEDLARDNAILQAAGRHNRLDVAGQGSFPCAGVYATVKTPGPLHVNDPVALS